MSVNKILFLFEDNLTLDKATLLNKQLNNNLPRKNKENNNG